MSAAMGRAAAVVSGQSVLVAGIVAGIADVAASVARFVSMEVVEALCPAFRQRSNVAVMRIKAVVDVPIKARMAVKPGASSNEYSAKKPVGPVITVRSTIIGSIVEVPVRAHGRWSDVYADRNLGGYRRHTA